MSTDTATELKPVHGDPEFIERTDYSDPLDVELHYIEPAAVAWDLSFGACLSFSAADDHDPLSVRIGLSDADAADHGTYRAVTREQVLAFAEHLLRLVDARPVLNLVPAAEVSS